MKKLIAFLLVAVMCLSFVACNNESGTAETPSNGENTENNSGSTSNTTTNENDSTNDGTTNEDETTNDTTNGDEITNDATTEDTSENEELEEKYNWVIERLNAYEKEGYFSHDDMKVMEDDAFLYLYNKLKELGGYKDCEDYIAKFIIVPNALVRVIRETTDNFGQTKTEIDEQYYYNENGKCAELDDFFKLIDFRGTPNLDPVLYDYEYSEDNHISGIRIYSSANLTIFKIKFEYDANGNIVKAIVQTGDSEYTNTYTYNEKNQLLTADIARFPYITFGDVGYASNLNGIMGITAYGHKAEYEYDDFGNLVSVTRNPYREKNNPLSLDTSSFFTDKYIYDENGLLTQHMTSWRNYDDTGASIEVYTYDEYGKILSAEVTEGDETFTLVYHYKTLCYYTGK